MQHACMHSSSAFPIPVPPPTYTIIPYAMMLIMFQITFSTPCSTAYYNNSCSKCRSISLSKNTETDTYTLLPIITLVYCISIQLSSCINQVWPQIYPFIHAMPCHFMAAKEKVTREGSWHVKSTTISEKVQPSERYHLTPLHTTHIYYRAYNVIRCVRVKYTLLLLSSIAFSIFFCIRLL